LIGRSSRPWLVGVLLAACSSPSHSASGAAEAGDEGSDARGTGAIDAAADATLPEAGSATDGAAGGDRNQDDTGSDAAAPAEDAGASAPLGMNDVTILAPLPSPARNPVLLRGGDLADDQNALIPRDLFDRLAEPMLSFPVMTAEDYDRMQLVAVRFDLCDRDQPGPCAPEQDGRLRLVFQPFIGFLTFDGRPDFFDAALHAFYVIPEAELAATVSRLRALAAMQGDPADAALQPSPALSDPAQTAYAEGVRALVRALASKERLVRLALNAQPVFNAQVRWVLRGLERRPDGTFEDMSIAGSSAPKQEVLSQGPGFEVIPASDTPQGVGGILMQEAFARAEAAQQRSMLEVLVAVDNPLTHGLATASCVSCHTATILLEARSKAAGIEVSSLSGAFTSTRNLSIDAGKLAVRRTTLRALGYQHDEPMISRRVVHETAQVLREIEQRYP
jgi:hypothetical protein